MTVHLHALAFVSLIALAATPSAAQSSNDLSSAASKAASALKSAAKDKLLIADLLGAQVSDPTSKSAGTVEDLVAVPGGRIVAALIKPAGGGGTIPVPFTLLKLSLASGKVNASLPRPLTEIKGSGAVQQLSQALGSTSSGGGDTN